jgi:hypothetical protein
MIMSENNDASQGANTGSAENKGTENKGTTGTAGNVAKSGQARKRIPLGTRNILTAPKKPGFVRRFVNDKGDRIQAFKDAGWAAAEAVDKVGDDKAGKVTSMGSSATPHVGGGQRAVLMEIPDEYYQADEKAKQDKLKLVEDEIKRSSGAPGRDGLDGKISIS